MRSSRTLNPLSDQFLMVIVFAFLHMVKLDQGKHTQWYDALDTIIQISSSEFFFEKMDLFFSVIM